MRRQILQSLAILIGAILIGSDFGWLIGTSSGLIAWALMPGQAE